MEVCTEWQVGNSLCRLQCEARWVVLGKYQCKRSLLDAYACRDVIRISPEKAHPRLILSLPLARLGKANDIPKLLCPIPYRLQARSCRRDEDA